MSELLLLYLKYLHWLSSDRVCVLVLLFWKSQVYSGETCSTILVPSCGRILNFVFSLLLITHQAGCRKCLFRIPDDGDVASVYGFYLAQSPWTIFFSESTAMT